jgi:protein involved in polysaccharide export with SLBB domain
MALMPFDKVYIRTAPNYEAQKSVYIDGEMAYPGSYTIKDKAQRISDLVQLAGGLKKGAYPQGAVFQRDSSVVAIDLSLILANPQQSENLLLLAGIKLRFHGWSKQSN